MKRIVLAKALLLSTSLVVIFSSCSKSDDDANTATGKATVNVHMTDGPADYDAIYLDVQSVELTMEGTNPVVLTPIRPGLYDILRFRNGLDTLLMRAEVPAGKVGQIRLVLGNNNSIVVDGQSYPLSTPSGQTSGVKLNLNQTFAANGAYDIWIDFDAAKSILQTGNGSYKLKPVVRAYATETNGRIRGYLLPAGSTGVVYAIQGVDTFTAIPDPVDGYFRISGLPAGNYNIWVDADGILYQDVTIPNVQVNYATETNLGNINLVP